MASVTIAAGISSSIVFDLGGPARFFVAVSTIGYLQEVIRYAHQNNIPFFTLGKGSNVLFDDRGFDCMEEF